MTQDYYSLLGVPRDATADQIKKAFRVLAFRHHPDGCRLPGSASLFQQAVQAYECLSDPASRRKYDLLPRRRPAGKSHDLIVWIDPCETHAQDEKQVEIDVDDHCPNCAGVGRRSARCVCPCCREGRLIQAQAATNRDLPATPCAICRGKGYLEGYGCETCGGNGLVPVKDKLFFKIPERVEEGQVLLMRGAGSAGAGGGPRGDVRVTIRLSMRPAMAIETPETPGGRFERWRVGRKWASRRTAAA